MSFFKSIFGFSLFDGGNDCPRNPYSSRHEKLGGKCQWCGLFFNLEPLEGR